MLTGGQLRGVGGQFVSGSGRPGRAMPGRRPGDLGRR